MKNDEPISNKNQVKEDGNSVLEDIIREGARRLLQAAVEHEISAYIDMFKEIKDEDGRRMVVRHGFLPERSLLTGMGPIAVKQPRVRDKREGERFTSAILPRYMRRVPSLDNLIPVLYLKGISTGDFTGALEAILGKDAQGLSASRPSPNIRTTRCHLAPSKNGGFCCASYASCFALLTWPIVTSENYYGRLLWSWGFYRYGVRLYSSLPL